MSSVKISKNNDFTTIAMSEGLYKHYHNLYEIGKYLTITFFIGLILLIISIITFVVGGKYVFKKLAKNITDEIDEKFMYRYPFKKILRNKSAFTLI